MKLPKGVPLVESTKLEFLNIDNVLHAGKRDRKHRVWGYVSIIYSDSLDLLFLKNGEPFNAARLTPKTRKILPINDIVKRAKETNLGILSVYSVDEDLIRMIITTVSSKPIKAGVDGEKIKIPLLFKKLGEKGFNGFLHVRRGLEESYIKFEQGMIKAAYTAGNQDKIRDPNRVSELFAAIPDLFIDIYETEETGEEQAAPAMVEMLYTIFTKIFQSLSEPLGESIVARTAIKGRVAMQHDYPFMSTIKINPDLSLSGDIVATPDKLIEAFASWLNILLESFSTFLGDETSRVIKAAIADYRFVLKSAGFFKISKLKID